MDVCTCRTPRAVALNTPLTRRSDVACSDANLAFSPNNRRPWTRHRVLYTAGGYTVAAAMIVLYRSRYTLPFLSPHPRYSLFYPSPSVKGFIASPIVSISNNTNQGHCGLRPRRIAFNRIHSGVPVCYNTQQQGLWATRSHHGCNRCRRRWETTLRHLQQHLKRCDHRRSREGRSRTGTLPQHGCRTARASCTIGFETAQVEEGKRARE